MRGYYESFSHFPESVARDLDEIESRALSKSRLLVYSSSWAAESAIADYGTPCDKVRVISFGANLDEVPPLKIATQKQRKGPCRLLFLGRDWVRKGGDIAFDCMVSLIKSGVDAELTICGCTPPPGVQHEKMVVLGLLDKMKRRQRRHLHRLLLRSHFLVLPTQADCTPIVCCEANAFGLPVISTHTGGIPSIIENGLNGLMLPLGARGEDFARAIAEIFCDEDRYRAMVLTSRHAYEQRLNWSTWASAMLAELSAVASVQYRSKFAVS
jgi:glycosyltransferase involved in cell wall biosynthesis